MIRRTPIFWLLLVFAGAAAWAVAEPGADELEQNRDKLKLWRGHPEQLERLRQDLRAFLELPAERRDKILRLDEELRRETPALQTRLEHVLKRYADWLDRLPEKERLAIQQAPNKTARLALIRALRDQVWMTSRPKTVRETWEKLDGNARVEFVKQLRLEARKQHQQWLLASRFWHELESKKALPCRLGDFSDKVQKYVHEYLTGMLTDAEKQRLAAAEGHWPDYPQTLVEIASKHPSALPPAGKDLPRHLDQLPPPIRLKVALERKGVVGKKPSLPKQLAPYVNSPDFASKVVEYGTKAGNQPFEFEFWACNFKSLLPPMAAFVEKELIPALTPADRDALAQSVGRWPIYPVTIQELAKKHNLNPPWHVLPEPKKYKWDSYKVHSQTR